MANTNFTQEPTSCPWGPIRRCKQEVPGLPIYFLATGTNSGYAVNRQWAEKHLTPELIAMSSNASDGCNWLYFEEDPDSLPLWWEVANLPGHAGDAPCSRSDLQSLLRDHVPTYDLHAISNLAVCYA